MQITTTHVSSNDEPNNFEVGIQYRYEVKVSIRTPRKINELCAGGLEQNFEISSAGKVKVQDHLR